MDEQDLPLASPLELTSTRTYELDGIPYVPHYRLRGTYVAPGGSMKMLGVLLAKGATPTEHMLWPRET